MKITAVHRGHAAILKVAAIFNNVLQTNKTCCIIKILAAIAFNVLHIEKKVTANIKRFGDKIKSCCRNKD